MTYVLLYVVSQDGVKKYDNVFVLNADQVNFHMTEWTNHSLKRTQNIIDDGQFNVDDLFWV